MSVVVVFGVVVDGPLEYVVPRARNPDLKEVVLRDTDGVVLMKFAQAYGFRNIQNMVRKIKPTAHDIHLGGGRDGCGYDYVEIMACPSGCLNGGGQLPPPPALPAGTMLDPSAPHAGDARGDDGEGARGRVGDAVQVGRRDG